jgi:hypothetical protein
MKSFCSLVLIAWCLCFFTACRNTEDMVATAVALTKGAPATSEAKIAEAIQQTQQARTPTSTGDVSAPEPTPTPSQTPSSNTIATPLPSLTPTLGFEEKYNDPKQLAYLTKTGQLWLVDWEVDYSGKFIGDCLPRVIDFRYTWGFSPDGTMILFAHTCTMGLGGKIIHLENGTEIPLEIEPYEWEWTSDGSRLLVRFTDELESGERIWRWVLVDTSNGKIVAEADAQDRVVAINDFLYTTIKSAIGENNIVNFKISPDGQKLAFLTEGSAWNQPYDFYVINIDGTSLVNLLENVIQLEWPQQITWEQFAWSPDSTKIVFYVYDYGAELWRDPIALINRPQVFVVTADGKSIVEITGDRFPYGRSPSWSPDGSQILFIGAENSDDAPLLVMCDANGENKRIIVHNGEYLDNAQFRPALPIP